MMLMMMLKGGIFAALLFISSVTDFRKRIIPNTVCLLIACTGIIHFEPDKLFGILIALPFLFAALLGNGMGGGDVKLAAAMGLVLGLAKGIAAVIIGLSAMLLFYGVYFIVQKLRGRECQRTLPLAPFLSLGCIAAYFMNFGGNVL
jgi:leader peptidase (prepilin peptidase)/N-methyltransferase